MKIEIELSEPVMQAITLLHVGLAMPINEVIQRLVITGIKTLQSTIAFNQAQQKNLKAGIEPTKEVQ